MIKISKLVYRAVKMGAVLTVYLAGCAGSVVMPDIDLDSPPWRVWSGQALWAPGPEHPTVVGEVLLALHRDGDTYINLAKPPLEIFVAQTHGKSWSIDLIEADRAHRGRGKAPQRFVWFYLPAVLAERAVLHANWHVERLDKQVWTFKNSKSGESIRLVLDE